MNIDTHNQTGQGARGVCLPINQSVASRAWEGRARGRASLATLPSLAAESAPVTYRRRDGSLLVVPPREAGPGWRASLGVAWRACLGGAVAVGVVCGLVVVGGGCQRARVRLRVQTRADALCERVALWGTAVARSVERALMGAGYRAIEAADMEDMSAIGRKWGLRAARVTGTAPGLRASSVRRAAWQFGPRVGASAAAVGMSDTAARARARRRAPIVDWSAVGGAGGFARGVWQAMELRAKSSMRRHLWQSGWELAAWDEAGEVRRATESGERHWQADDESPRTMARAVPGMAGTGSAMPVDRPLLPAGFRGRLSGLRLGLAVYWAGGEVTCEDVARGARAKGARSKAWGGALAGDLALVAAAADAAAGRGVASLCGLGLASEARDAVRLRTGERSGQRRADAVPDRLCKARDRMEARAAVGLHVIGTDGERARRMIVLVETAMGARGVSLAALERHLGEGAADGPAAGMAAAVRLARVAWGDDVVCHRAAGSLANARAAVLRASGSVARLASAAGAARARLVAAVDAALLSRAAADAAAAALPCVGMPAAALPGCVGQAGRIMPADWPAPPASSGWLLAADGQRRGWRAAPVRLVNGRTWADLLTLDQSRQVALLLGDGSGWGRHCVPSQVGDGIPAAGAVAMAGESVGDGDATAVHRALLRARACDRSGDGGAQDWHCEAWRLAAAAGMAGGTWNDMRAAGRRRDCQARLAARLAAAVLASRTVSAEGAALRARVARRFAGRGAATLARLARLALAAGRRDVAAAMLAA